MLEYYVDARYYTHSDIDNINNRIKGDYLYNAISSKLLPGAGNKVYR